jgi:hypothetical protein
MMRTFSFLTRYARTINKMSCIALACGCMPQWLHAQAGPPFQTNDPGTPGNGNWEINLAAAPVRSRDTSSWQIPQIDMNFGLGDRVQLTFEVPYIIQTGSSTPRTTGWSNAYPGIKWRFLDQGEDGWQASIFPQLETRGSVQAEREQIVGPATRVLLPVEVTHKLGPLDLDMEVGVYAPKDGVQEHIVGLVAGRSISDRLDFALELYNDHASGAPPNQTTLDLGGRYKLSDAFITLFMAGRSVSGTSNGQPEFFGYFGIQILLGDYGRHLQTAKESIHDIAEHQ